jgi:hypothetical protein
LCDETGIEADKAFMNTFANGANVYSVYTPGNVSDENWSKLVQKVNLALSLPERTFLDDMYRNNKINIEEKFYLYSAAQFAYYFCIHDWNGDFESVMERLDKDKNEY